MLKIWNNNTNIIKRILLKQSKELNQEREIGSAAKDYIYFRDFYFQDILTGLHF